MTHQLTTDMKKIKKNLVIEMSTCIIGSCGLTYISMMFSFLSIELEMSELVTPLAILGGIVFPVLGSIIAGFRLCYYLKEVMKITT